MNSNIEIKARARDFEKTQGVAESIADGPAKLLEQEDTFFTVPQGRLKLRVINSSQAELIYYERPESEGPRASHYLVLPVPDPEKLKAIFKAVMGIRGVVRKRRWLYLAGQTRIHLDDVDGLGHFVELEYVMRPGQRWEEGTGEVRRIMGLLGIAEKDLVPVAYVDLLANAEFGMRNGE